MIVGYRDDTGKIIEAGLPNLTFEFLCPKPKPTNWRCTICNNRMKLLPIDKSIPPVYWECPECKRQISIEDRDKVFDEITRQIQQEYNLRNLEYIKSNDIWIIESAEWIGDDRITSIRKKISVDTRKDILYNVIVGLEDALSIHVESVKDYFQYGS